MAEVERAGDRREGSRREVERNLHYAEVGLLAAAVALVDAGTHDPAPPAEVDGTLWTQLERAVATYRRAEADAHAART